MTIDVSGQRSVTYSTSNLYVVAARELGDARQWYRIAIANGMVDPWFTTTKQLIIPPKLASGSGNGGILGSN
jgi:hypothetical protein